MSDKITEDDFLKDLKDYKNLKRTRKKEIFDLAWQAKNFEIELYWKRAGYFWAFQALVLAGLIAIASSKDLIEQNLFLHYTICLGLITSLGWYLTNKGSKVWQRHWESIVDVLEDYYIGKLYKTNTTKITFSVSKINELISLFFTVLWTYLFLKSNLYDNIDYSLKLNQLTLDWGIFLPDAIVLYIIWQMYYGKGRGRFKERDIQFYRRNIKVN